MANKARGWHVTDLWFESGLPCSSLGHVGKPAQAALTRRLCGRETYLPATLRCSGRSPTGTMMWA